MRKLTPIFLLVGILFGGMNAQAAAQTAELSNLNISNLPFCDVPLNRLVEIVNQAKQTSGALEPLYNSLTILYNQKKGEYQSGSSSLDPDQVDYCRFTKLDDESGDLEIPIHYATWVASYWHPYSGYSHPLPIGKMVISAQGDHALIRSINGVPTNIKIYFNPPDIKVTKGNVMSLLESQFSFMSTDLVQCPFRGYVNIPPHYYQYYYDDNYSYNPCYNSTPLYCQLPSQLRQIKFIKPIYKVDYIVPNGYYDPDNWLKPSTNPGRHPIKTPRRIECN